MRRVVPVLLASIFGLVLLLSFHTSPEGGITTSPKVGAEAPSTTTPIAGAGPPGTSSSSAGSSPPTTATERATYTGTEVDNRYGPVQVAITVDGTRLVDIAALQMPSDRAHSQRLSQEAAPILRTEAISTQSARIDVVSGATFTSESYAQSLQSALDQANLGH
jgi:uncharacterized protein with FMN-binding domain